MCVCACNWLHVEAGMLIGGGVGGGLVDFQMFATNVWWDSNLYYASLNFFPLIMGTLFIPYNI